MENCIKQGQFMKCSKNNINIYALNHEFGHLIENYVINEYNLSNLVKYINLLRDVKNATRKSKSMSIYSKRI